jgi:hypothetical protein
MLIAFTGAAGSGKSTASRFLVEERGFTLVKFAAPLKDMLRAIGLTEDEIEGHLKEKPCATLCGRSPRHAMITLGTEWGRDLIDDGFWVSLWARRVARILDEGGSVVTDDCRFDNEAAAVEGLGGSIVKVIRPGADMPVINHVSENGVAAHLSIFNDGPPEILRYRVDGLIHWLPLKRLA